MTLMEEDDPQAQAAEPLIPIATDVVQVVAPATLPENYALDVTTVGPDGELLSASVVVPSGGVDEGERFTASAQYMDIPTDRWRDGIFSCFRFGCCHPTVVFGLFCFPVMLAQVMTRMDLTWIGDVRHPDSLLSSSSIPEQQQRQRSFGLGVLSTFKLVMVVYAIYLLGLYVKGNLLEEMMELPIPLFLPMSWWDFMFWVYCFMVVMKTRSYIRRRYSIPESECHGCEDCCAAFFCLPLTVCQMARHTADYDTYRANPCSENGLPTNAPTIV